MFLYCLNLLPSEYITFIIRIINKAFCIFILIRTNEATEGLMILESPPKWFPMNLTSWWSRSSISYFHIESNWPAWPTECYKSDHVWLLRLDHKRHCDFCLGALDHSSWWSSNCAMSALKQPFEEAHVEKNWASHQQLGPTCKPCEWTNFKGDFSIPVKLSDQCSLSWHLTMYLREFPSQNCPAKLHLNYWMTEIVR